MKVRATTLFGEPMRRIYAVFAALLAGGCCKCPDPTLDPNYEVRSDEILPGRTDIIYPNQDLASQDCRTHDAFPGKILCTRERTVVFDWR